MKARRKEYDEKQARAAAAAAFRHSFVVGDIVINTWGYEQTNADFYQVVSVTEKTISIRAIEDTVTETGFMCGHAVPRPDVFKAESPVLVKRPRDASIHGPHWVKGSVPFEFGAAHWWDGLPVSCSWYG
jgi:hypothetical protein